MAPLDPIWVQNGNYSATEDRILIAALTGSRHFTDLAPLAAARSDAGGGHGTVGPGDLTVSQNGTPNMTVSVSSGLAFIRGTQQGDQGVYLGANDAAYSVAIAAADATNPRKDLIVARITDTDYGAGASAFVIDAVTGTAAGSPAEPTPPENSLVLALVDVPANDTAIGNAQITDRRTRAYALGGIPSCTSTTRPSVPYGGQVIYERDMDRIYVYSNVLGTWRFVHHGGGENRLVKTYTPGGNVDSGDTFAAWLTTTSMTVPSWAARAIVTVSITGWFDTTGDNDYLLRAVIGSDVGAVQVRTKPATASSRASVTWSDQITLTGTGSKTFIVQADKLAGTGVFRADTSSILTANIEFLP